MQTSVALRDNGLPRVQVSMARAVFDGFCRLCSWSAFSSAASTCRAKCAPCTGDAIHGYVELG